MQTMRIFLFIALSALGVQAQQPAGVKKLDSVLTVLYKTNRFNGTVLYGEKGKVIYKKAFGVTDYRTNQLLTTTLLLILHPLPSNLSACAL